LAALIAEKFGIEHQHKPEMLELPMIQWECETLEEEMLGIQAINQRIDSEEDPRERSYNTL
jgi:hypothetical protein